MGSTASQQTIADARRMFFRDGTVPTTLVPSPILESWRRCAGAGLDAASRPRIEPLTAGELRREQSRHDLLRRASRAEIAALSAVAGATDCIIVLTDPSGLVLETVGDAEFASRAARISLSPGACWDETTTGTNAIGTAIVEGRPVLVRGGQHYFEPHRILSCAAVPIHAPTGEIIGVIDLTGPSGRTGRHSLGLVDLAVEQIEHRLFDGRFADCDVLALAADASMLDTSRESILVFRDDRLVAANRSGLRLLETDRAAIGSERFETLFKDERPRSDGIETLRTRAGASLFAKRRIARQAWAPGRDLAAPADPAAPILDRDATAALERSVRLVNGGVPVLVHGETGSGKEMFARRIHALGKRATKPFVAINCAALPESLIEAELFGYEDGAFTGARRNGARGLLRQADGGVLFLDEIGDMPLALQARLLRVLQDREVRPLGGGKAVPVDFHLVCATHRNLKELVDDGRFRADLYYRVAQYTVELRPLRDIADRRDVVGALWQRLAPNGLKLGADALDRIVAHDWPGNFRQLSGTLRALVALAGTEEGEIGLDMLPADIAGGRDEAPAGAANDLEAITIAAMRRTLEEAGGNVSLAARRLGIDRTTLYRRLLWKAN
ncbi:MAG: sigma-54-dependent Fis family transcriptional regulator [Hyphomicrobiales bacterium]